MGAARFFLVLFFCSLIVACGGGGGGGGGRTRETAIRILHGAVESPPLAVRGTSKEGIADILQTAKFAEQTAYIPLKEGPQDVRVEQANAPEIVARTFSQVFNKETEYSIFAYPGADGATQVKLIEEPVAQPAKGNARLRILNAAKGQSSITVNSSGISLQAVPFGGVSDFVEIPIGPRRLQFRGDGSISIGYKDINPSEQAEIYLVVSGTDEFSTFFITEYDDLD